MANILIVDDDQTTAAQLAQGLQQAGHTCAVRGSGKDALDLARTQPPDLLVLDVMLPDLSGFEVCRQLRKDAALYTLPIVFISAMNNPEEVEHGLDQGADDYVTKPFDMGQVVVRLEGLLRSVSGGDQQDSVTELPDSDGTRRRIQQLISRGKAFALVYAELLNLREFSRAVNEADRDKALRHAARALRMSGEAFEEKDFFVGHLGGGFFICSVPLGDAKAFCTKVQRGWRNHMKTLYASVDLGKKLDSEEARKGGTDPILDILFCVTVYEADAPVSAQHLMDTLSRIRRTLGTVSVGGIHMDRRQ